jgi:FKBP-type peptidyl-prolyl cis-trans isomerase (trigger factor)
VFILERGIDLKILSQDKKGNQVILEVEEEYSKLDPNIEKAYEEASRDVKMPGFRQGKVPANLLKKYINEEAVIDRAVQFLMSDIYPELIGSANIKPVDYPNVEVKKLEKGSPVIFTFKVDVYPVVKLGAYKKIALKDHSKKVLDEDVDKTIDFVKKSYAQQVNVPENEVSLDDEFAKKVSRTNTMQELKTMIRSNIEEENKREADMATRDEVAKKLSETIEVDVPKGMVEREIDAMVSDLEISLNRSKMTLASYLSAVKKDMDKIRGEMKVGAEGRIKAKLALEAIAEKEQLAVEEADIDSELEALAKHYGKTVEEYKSEVSGDVIDSIKEYMLREKAIDFVISKAKVEE